MTLEVLFILDGQPRTLMTGLHSGLAVNRDGLTRWLLPPEMVHWRIVSRTAPAVLNPVSIIADNEHCPAVACELLWLGQATLTAVASVAVRQMNSGQPLAIGAWAGWPR